MYIKSAFELYKSHLCSWRGWKMRRDWLSYGILYIVSGILSGMVEIYQEIMGADSSLSKRNRITHRQTLVSIVRCVYLCIYLFTFFSLFISLLWRLRSEQILRTTEKSGYVQNRSWHCMKHSLFPKFWKTSIFICKWIFIFELLLVSVLVVCN